MNKRVIFKFLNMYQIYVYMYACSVLQIMSIRGKECFEKYLSLKHSAYEFVYFVMSDKYIFGSNV